MGKKLELQELEPYPLKVFLNIVSGKLSPQDIIFVSTKDLFDLFLKENFLTKIAKIQLEGKFSERELKKILREKESAFAEISGICFLILLQPEIVPKKAISFEKEGRLIPVATLFKPFLNKIKNLVRIPKRLAIKKPEIKIPSLVFPKNLLKINYQGFSRKIFALKKPELSKEFKKKLILILALIFLLIVGFFIFQREKQTSLKEKEKILSGVQEKINSAESFLTKKDEEKANEILKEAWKEISPLSEEKNALKEKVQTLQDHIWKNLADLNKLENIETPEVLTEFTEKEFLPQKMVELDNSLYFFNPNYNWLFKVIGQEKKRIETKEKLKNAIPFNENSVLFLSTKNTLSLLENDEFKENFNLKEPYSNFEFNDFSSFKGNLYFLDSKKGEILKYSFPPDSPQIWLNPEAKKPIGAKSMTIDGSIWILTDDNKIERYFGGKYQEVLNLDIFPEPKDLEKIFTSPYSPYLFILEPVQRRIIILNKKGGVISQFQSDKFDNLKDFTVSLKDNKIYLLNGLKIYQLKIK